MRYLVFSLLSLAVFAAYRFRTAEKPIPPCDTLPATEPVAGLLFQTDDAGATWQDIGRGLPADLAVTALAVGGDEVFVRTEDGMVYRSVQPAMGLWNAEEVKVIVPELGENPYDAPPIHGLFPGRNGVYATMPCGGIARQEPGSSVWTFINEGIKARVVHTVVERADGALFAATSEGIYTSFNDGKSWNHAYTKDWVNSLAVQGDVVFASVHGGLLRSADSGATWELAVADQGAGYSFATVNGGLAALRSAGAWESAGMMPPLRITADGGKTWTYIDGGLSSMRVYDIAEANGVWFCSTDDGILRSTDGGQSWTMAMPLNDPEKKNVYNLAVWGNRVLAVKMRAGC